MDNSSRLRFLVDTGAPISVIPATATDQKAACSNLILQAVNNSPIHTYGTRSFTLNLGLRRTLRWVFVIADTTSSSPRGHHNESHHQRYFVQRHFTQPHTAPKARKQPIPSQQLPGNIGIPVKHSVTHHILTDGPL